MHRQATGFSHADVINWKHKLRYWPFMRGIHRSPVNSPHKGQWRGTLVSYLICACINGWVNNHEAGDLSRHRAHHDVTVMSSAIATTQNRILFSSVHREVEIATCNISGLCSSRIRRIIADYKPIKSLRLSVSIWRKNWTHFDFLIARFCSI